MTERRPVRRRAQAAAGEQPADAADLNPYRDDQAATATAPEPDRAPAGRAAADDAPEGAAEGAPAPRTRARAARGRARAAVAAEVVAGANGAAGDAPPAASNGAPPVTAAADAPAVPAAVAPPAATPAPTPADDAPTNGAADAAPRARPQRPRRRGRGGADGAGAADTAGGTTGTADTFAPDAPAPAPAPAPAAAAVAPEVVAGTGHAAPATRDDAPPAPAADGARNAGNAGNAPGGPQGGHQGQHHKGPRHQQHQQHNRPRHERFEHRREQQRHDGQPRQDGARAADAGRADAAPGQQQGQRFDGQPRREFGDRPGRRQRHRNRQFRNEAGGAEPRPFVQPVADVDVTGWVELAKDGSGFVRQASNSYLPGPNDPFLPVGMVRQNNLRAGDRVEVGAGRDHRGRPVVVEVRAVDGAPPQPGVKRPEFQSLLATYPERKLRLETGAVAKGGPELTRRVVDLIAPVGFGQRALIVAPARSGKTMLLQAVVEGVAKNHPDAELLVLLVDERPEEVSDMVACGYGEVVASSFDMPAERHRDVVQMVMHRAQRLAELNRDVVIVLDSITRMARAFNATKGIGRTLSGGLDATAMATPKAFFGSARSIAASSGGGSITIIGTALVETGSRMDDVIFEEFKGTGNCEIKLDRSLAEQRIFPAIDIPASGTRREDKLFRPDQLDSVYLLRRGLQQMPPSAAMNWLSKRIGNTPSNDVLLATLKDV